MVCDAVGFSLDCTARTLGLGISHDMTLNFIIHNSHYSMPGKTTWHKALSGVWEWTRSFLHSVDGLLHTVHEGLSASSTPHRAMIFLCRESSTALEFVQACWKISLHFIALNHLPTDHDTGLKILHSWRGCSCAFLSWELWYFYLKNKQKKKPEGDTTPQIWKYGVTSKISCPGY